MSNQKIELEYWSNRDAESSLHIHEDAKIQTEDQRTVITYKKLDSVDIAVVGLLRLLV